MCEAGPFPNRVRSLGFVLLLRGDGASLRSGLAALTAPLRWLIARN